jgi:hypothetical protein
MAIRLQFRLGIGLLLAFASSAVVVHSAELTKDQQAKVEALLDSMSSLGKDPKVVAAVKAQNAKLPEVLKGMDNARWATLASTSPEVHAVSHTELTRYLRGVVHHTVIELFISDAEGRKVALFTKTTSFTHKGKPKHDLPMQGKKWIGDLELDESTQQMQVQGSFPVLDKGKPIGSVVLGFWVPKL